MAIALEFINLIIPIKRIEEHFPGGWEGCLKYNKDMIGGRIWYDEHLFRDGAMNPDDMKSLVDYWERIGLTSIVEVDGQQQFRDLCVVESMFGGVTLPCDWIAFDPKTRGAYYKGYEIGDLVRPDPRD